MIERTIKQESPQIVLLGIKLFFARLLLPRKYYNRYLNEQVKKISRVSLPVYAKDLIGAIKFNKNISKNYKNSYLETEALLQQFAVFKPFYLNFVNEVKEQRRKFNLPI